MSRLYLILAAALCGLVAGCGGTTKLGSPSESGATLVGSGAIAYAAVDSDLGSGQWQQVDTLLKKFPIRDRLLKEINAGLADQNLDYDKDIKPALGPEVDFAAAGSSPSDVAYVALTKPESIDKAKALVRKLDEGSNPSQKPTVTRVVDGWLVVSESQAMIDRVLKGSGSSLSDDTHFEAAWAKLPDEALAKVYANGRQVSNLFGTFFSGGAQTAAFGGGSSPFSNLDSLTASLVAKDDGLAATFHTEATGNDTGLGAPYSSKLLSGVPADALAFATFRGSGKGNPIDQLRQNPAIAPGIQQVEHLLGMQLEPILALFGHETAIYVRRGAGLPEISLVLETPDTERALGTIDRLAARVAQLSGAKLAVGPGGVKTLDLGRFAVHWAGFDWRVLLTSGPTGIEDYRGHGDKLADSARFKEALDGAGAPAETNGLLYVAVDEAAKLVFNYLGLAGEKVPTELSENLKPLRSFVAFATTDGGVGNATAFLEVK